MTTLEYTTSAQAASGNLQEADLGHPYPMVPIDNQAVALLASGARTTTQTSADQTNITGQIIHVILDVTSAGTGSVTLSILGKDPASGKYYTILAGAAVTTNSTNVYKVGPGLPATANVSANDGVPLTFQILVTANNANTMTYSVGYNLIG